MREILLIFAEFDIENFAFEVEFPDVLELRVIPKHYFVYWVLGTLSSSN